jgi:HSP20 family protein
MPMDAYRHGDHVVVHVDVPGIDPASIEVTVDQDVLTVRGQRSWQPEDGDVVFVQERPSGSFSRKLFLGKALDSERIEAAYHDGVLTVTAPIADHATSRKVEITVGPRPEQLESESAA